MPTWPFRIRIAKFKSLICYENKFVPFVFQKQKISNSPVSWSSVVKSTSDAAVLSWYAKFIAECATMYVCKALQQALQVLQGDFDFLLKHINHSLLLCMQIVCLSFKRFF